VRRCVADFGSVITSSHPSAETHHRLSGPETGDGVLELSGKGRTSGLAAELALIPLN
jgi:hypothetical protein